MLGLKKKVKTKEEIKKEYREFIAQSVETGDFFKDSFEWYSFNYLKPICDRSWLLLVIILNSIILYVVMLMIEDSFPLVRKVPIVINEKDSASLLPAIYPLKESDAGNNLEESVVKYLLIKYLKDREEYNFEIMTTKSLGQKFDVIKNNSSPSEFRKFKASLSLDNPQSPIRYFGKNIIKTIKINSFKFEQEEANDFMSKARKFVTVHLPSKADIDYQLTTDYGDKKIINHYLAKIEFRFPRIDSENLNKNLNFAVSNYNLFIVNKK